MENAAVIPDPKFKVGHVVNTNDKGYQWAVLNSSSMEDIKKHRVASCIYKGLTITEIQYCNKSNIYWYKITTLGNYYSEDSIEPTEQLLRTTFKKDEYIVINTNSILLAPNWLFNYCFKIREEHIYLRPYLDCNGSNTNGIASVNFQKTTNWRYATKGEADEYERRGKPYNVNILENKELSRLEDWEPSTDTCKKCADRFYNGSVNSGPHNLCEGRHCGDMQELEEEEQHWIPKIGEWVKVVCFESGDSLGARYYKIGDVFKVSSTIMSLVLKSEMYVLNKEDKIIGLGGLSKALPHEIPPEPYYEGNDLVLSNPYGNFNTEILPDILGMSIFDYPMTNNEVFRVKYKKLPIFTPNKQEITKLNFQPLILKQTKK